jgi:hypothetical protein
MLRRNGHSPVKNVGLYLGKAVLGERHVIPTIFKVARDLFSGLPNLS